MCIKETFNKYSYLSEPFYFDQSKLMTLYLVLRATCQSDVSQGQDVGSGVGLDILVVQEGRERVEPDHTTLITVIFTKKIFQQTAHQKYDIEDRETFQDI